LDARAHFHAPILAVFRAAVLAGAALAAPAAAETAKLVYALPAAVPAVLPFVAVDGGFFRAEGLDVEPRMFSSGREALQALLSGSAQIQSVSETPVVHALIQGNAIAVIATVARHQEAKLIVRPDRGISRPEDLAGKRVATLPGTNSDYFMYKFLAAHGLTPAQVRVANMPPPEMVSAFAKGDIDGYFAWEPHIRFGLDAVPGARVFLPGTLYRGWMTVNMDPAFARANPETTRKVLRALIKAEAYVKTHKEESIKLVARRLGMDEKVLRALWDQSLYRVELDGRLTTDMEEIGRWSLGLSKSDKPLPNFRQSIYDEPLRRERPTSVSL
jgi:ABC-type nitrate/sulfonate/bicarbonate transport system substrate-binding protein